MDNHIEIEVEKQDKGFTLVELLIVIVILGILATVTVFAVRGITDQGQDSACAADEKTLAVAAESYFANFGGTAIPTSAVGDTTPVPADVVVGATPVETLAASGLLRDASDDNWTMNANGDLTATPAGPCVPPAP